MRIDFETLGDVQKKYERVEAGRAVMPGIPVLARLDGVGFHKFTKGMERPFDGNLSHAMRETLWFLMDLTNAKVGYTQSDEITICWSNSDEAETKIFYGGKFQKLCSILAARASVEFDRQIAERMPKFAGREPAFDCRVWQVPNLMVAAENFRWREQDARKNSITMAASHYYSHNELMNKHSGEKLLMLADKGVDWNEYPAYFKQGSYIKKVKKLVYPTKDELAEIPTEYWPEGPIERNKLEWMSWERSTKILNWAQVLFTSEEPKIETQESTADV